MDNSVYDFDDNHASEEEDTTPVATPGPSGTQKHGRNTNQLSYLHKKVLLSLWKHHYAWPFHVPVDADKLNLKVTSIGIFNFYAIDHELNFL